MKGEPSVVLETLCFIGSEYKRDKTHPEITAFLTTRARVTLQVRVDIAVGASMCALVVACALTTTPPIGS